MGLLGRGGGGGLLKNDISIVYQLHGTAYSLLMADQRKGYSPEVARMAIEAYKTKRGSFREIVSASRMSTLTLYRLTTGEVVIDDGRVGAKPILSRAAEAGLIKAIVFMNFRGVGMTKEEVFEAAKALAEEEGCTFKGEDGLPTKHWWDGF